MQSDFTVIWDQRFVTPLKVFPPMDYTAPSPNKVEEVTQHDLNECFVQYILVRGRVRLSLNARTTFSVRSITPISRFRIRLIRLIQPA